MYKVFSRILVVVVIAIVLFISLLPTLVQWQASKILAAQGIELNIENLVLTLRKGEAQIEGLHVKRNEEFDFKVSSLTLKLDLLSIFDEKIKVNNFKLTQLIAQLPNNKLVKLDTLRLEGNITTQLPNNNQNSTQRKLSIDIPNGLTLNKLEFSQDLQSIIQFNDGIMEGIKLELISDIESSDTVQLNLSSIVINDASILGREHLSREYAKDFSEHISIEQTRLKQLTFEQTGKNSNSPNKLSAHSLGFSGLNVLLLKVPANDPPNSHASQSHFAFLDAVQSLKSKPKYTPEMSPQADLTTAIAESEKPSLQTALDKLSLNNGSSLTLIDASHTPATTRHFHDILLQVSDINQSKPKDPSPFTLNAKTDEYGSITLQGHIKPFLASANISVTGQVKSLDLTPLSAYAENSAAHTIKSGHLDAEIKVSVIDNKIDAQALLDLRKFYLDKLNKKEQLKDTEATNSMPLSTALNLLRDNDDRIKFKLPITGNINAPNFSLQHILGIVARKAITEAVVNYYTPFGLLSVTSALISSATQLRFEPVPFNAGKNILANDASENIIKLAALLAKKKSLTLTLCPVISAGDWRQRYQQHKDVEAVITAEQSTVMEYLGVERGALVKNSLVQQGVAAEQIIICKVTVNKNENGAGFVSVEL